VDPAKKLTSCDPHVILGNVADFLGSQRSITLSSLALSCKDFQSYVKEYRAGDIKSLWIPPDSKRSVQEILKRLLPKHPRNPNETLENKVLETLIFSEPLSGRPVTAKDLEFIAKNFKGLETLNLSHTQITDAGVAHLASLTQLKKLWLAGNQITDISPLASLTQLQILDLQKNAITDVPPFPSLRQLDLLWLSENPITDERLEQLATRLHMIRHEKNLIRGR
jgi:hypothetical protein